MPYGKGLSITATNRGKRPTPAVGLSVSYEPATEAARDDVSASHPPLRRLPARRRAHHRADPPCRARPVDRPDLRPARRRPAGHRLAGRGRPARRGMNLARSRPVPRPGRPVPRESQRPPPERLVALSAAGAGRLPTVAAAEVRRRWLLRSPGTVLRGAVGSARCGIPSGREEKATATKSRQLGKNSGRETAQIGWLSPFSVFSVQLFPSGPLEREVTHHSKPCQ